jgi:DNA-binding CsgD family transcriptional regulator/tetratricopeptide (TPR) repeat protein
MVNPDYLCSMTAEVPDLPGSLGSSSIYPFVGRGAEMEKLRALVPRAPGEGRRIALISGEPGVGKSRLVREFAAATAGDRAFVLYGSCDAAVRSPYGPFVEALDQLLREGEIEDLRAALGESGELARLLPELPNLVDGLPDPVSADPDTERHRLHMAVADLLEAVSRSRPIVLVIEDAHWADAPTLQLLRHLARSTWGARVLVLMTVRESSEERSAELDQTLADLQRSEHVARIRLAGLSGSEVADLVAAVVGGRAGEGEAAELAELAGAIHDLTAGNAFLVCELWRALAETGMVKVSAGSVRLTGPLAELGTPESVRDVVSQRLARLTAATAELLELAAVAGPEFELGAIRRAARLPEPELAAALEQAVASGMLEELPPPRLAFRFTHELVRRALYDRLSALRRAELHLRVGEGLEEDGSRSVRLVVDLAHHFGAAAQLGGAARAITYNREAARSAVAALAYADAADHLRAAIEIGIEPAAERAAVLLDLGAASNRGGRAADALVAFTEVAGIARATGDPALLARAAIGYEESCWRPGLVTGGAVERLEEGLAALGEGDQQLRIDLLAGLGRALGFQGQPDRAAIVRENAVALSRASGDRLGLARVLVRSYWLRGSTPLAEILAMLTEARDIASELGDSEIEAEATGWRAPTLVALCDLEAAEAEVALLEEMAGRTGQPFTDHIAAQYGSALALCTGELDEAERLARRSRESGELLSGWTASGTFGIQMFGIRREQGRLAELAPALRVLAADPERVGPWRPGMVAVLVELGMESEARHELAVIAAEGIEGYRPSLWLAALTYLTDAAAALDDRRMAAIVYPELLPFAGTNVMIGHLVACQGAADRYLGMLAATLGDAAAAERHFEAAMELNRNMGAPTWLAHTACEYGRFLYGRDRPRAASLLAEATAIADRCGLDALLGRVRSLGGDPPPPAGPDGLSPREVQVLTLVARGFSNRRIGEELSISEHTAANHIRSILRKTECANRTEAASFAHRHGLVSL